MRTFYLILLSLILVSTVFGQEKAKTSAELIKDGCGRRRVASEKTGVLTTVHKQISAGLPFTADLAFSFQGDVLTRTIDKFLLSFRLNHTKADWGFVKLTQLGNMFDKEFLKEWRFEDKKNLTITADGESFRFEKSINRSKSAGIRRELPEASEIEFTERIYFEVDRETVSKIGKAKDIRVKLADLESVEMPKAAQMFQKVLDCGSLY